MLKSKGVIMVEVLILQEFDVKENDLVTLNDTNSSFSYGCACHSTVSICCANDGTSLLIKK